MFRVYGLGCLGFGAWSAQGSAGYRVFRVLGCCVCERGVGILCFVFGAAGFRVECGILASGTLASMLKQVKPKPENFNNLGTTSSTPRELGLVPGVWCLMVLLRRMVYTVEWAS